MDDINELKLVTKGYSLLYVEDNDKLRVNASTLFNKIFETVHSASDGKEGLALFKEHSPSIVVTDIKMPHMDGMKLTQHIKDINPATKVILMSAFEDSAFLYRAIELGVFRFIKKPVKVNELIDVLYSCIMEIKKEHESQLFNVHLQNVFNYQSSIVIMMKGSQPTFVNQMFLNYFEVENLKEFREKYGVLGSLFLKHDSFLYSTADKNWFDELSANPQKLYNIKLLAKDESFKHFILKYQEIPDKESFGILSFDDVTELNLLQLYDNSQSKSDESIKDSKAMFKLLEVLQRNNATIELHNFYKGLSITNNAVITELGEKNLIIKTKYLQQRAMHAEGKTIIVSEALPQPIECSKVLNVNFEQRSVELQGLRFVRTSPIARKTIRVVPGEKQTVSLFLGQNKFFGDIKIEDMSLEAIKLTLNALPPGLEKGDVVHLDIVLEMDKKPLIINTEAVMLRKSETRYNFSIVFLFQSIKKSGLIKYITTRQMAIIREFKLLEKG